MVICELLGAPYSDAPDIRRWTGVLMTSVLTPEELLQAETDMQGYLADLVERSGVRPDNALITALVAAHDEGGHLTSAELLANLQMLLAAGHDTTVNQLGNSLLTLLRHPAELQRLIDDPALINSAVDELLRYSRLMAATLPRVTTGARRTRRRLAAGGRGRTADHLVRQPGPRRVPGPRSAGPLP